LDPRGNNWLLACRFGSVEVEHRASGCAGSGNLSGKKRQCRGVKRFDERDLVDRRGAGEKVFRERGRRSKPEVLVTKVRQDVFKGFREMLTTFEASLEGGYLEVNKRQVCSLSILRIGPTRKAYR